MGSVFRKITTRPLPTGAELFTRRRKVAIRLPDGTRRADHTAGQCARWQDARGKNRVERVATSRDGTVCIRQESSTYFATYRDHDGKVHVGSTTCIPRSPALHLPLHQLPSIWCNQSHLRSIGLFLPTRRKSLICKGNVVFLRSWGSRIRT